MGRKVEFKTGLTPILKLLIYLSRNHLLFYFDKKARIVMRLAQFSIERFSVPVYSCSIIENTFLMLIATHRRKSPDIYSDL